MIEAALIILLFITIILSMIDLGVAVLRYNLLSEAARQGARQAIVHGNLAPSNWNGGPWSPKSGYPGVNPYKVSASSSSDAIASGIRAYLPTIDPSKVNITVQWPDGDILLNQRVQVTLTYTYQPMTTFFVPITLTATSTMPIAHSNNNSSGF
jgi:Flp pilus assembly protein TadG